MKKQFPWFEVTLVVVFMSIQIYAALSDGYNFPNTWFSRDDAYYYFKVAQNISEGRGSTFDGIHPSNGYHPLWMLICIPIFALARFDLILPLRILLITMSGLSLASAILLYRWIRDAISPVAGMLAAIYWLFDFYIQIVFYRPGLESGIALFLTLFLLYLLFRFEQNWRESKPGLKQIAIIGVLATLATLGRLDLIFFCAIIGIWIVFRASPIRYILPLDVLVIWLSVLGAFVLRVGLPEYYSLSSSALAMIIINLLVDIPVYFFCGLYQRPSGWNTWKIIQRGLLATAISGGIVSALALLAEGLRILIFSPLILVFNMGFNILGVLLIRLAAHRFNGESGPTPFLNPVGQLKENWNNWLKEGAVYYGILAGALSIYMIYNKLTFGIFSPISGQIKRWWASPAINIYSGEAGSLLDFLGLDGNGEFSPWQRLTSNLFQGYKYIYQNFNWAYPLDVRHKIYPVLLMLTVIVTCAFLMIQYRKTIAKSTRLVLIPLFIGSWIQILSYSTTGYSSPKEWYWLTEQIFLVLIAVLLIDLLYMFLLKRWNFVKPVAWAVIIFYGASSVIQYSQDVRVRMPYGYSYLNRAYMDVVPFLESLTQPGDVVGLTGGGNVAYFIHDRTIVNMDGLINSHEYFQALKNGTSADYLYDGGMRYVFTEPVLINSSPYRGQYDGRLQPIKDWGGKYLMRLLPKSAP